MNRRLNLVDYGAIMAIIALPVLVFLIHGQAKTVTSAPHVMDLIRPLGAIISVRTVDGPLDVKGFISALDSTGYVAPHHSNPKFCRRVIITGTSGTLELKICRDSHRGDEFWVFSNQYGYHGSFHSDIPVAGTFNY